MKEYCSNMVTDRQPLMQLVCVEHNGYILDSFSVQSFLTTDAVRRFIVCLQKIFYEWIHIGNARARIVSKKKAPRHMSGRSSNLDDLIMTNNFQKRNCLPKGCVSSDQLSIFDLVLPSTDGLTTEQVSKHLGLPISDLRKCPIEKFVELKSFVLLHKGRNQWRLIKTQA